MVFGRLFRLDEGVRRTRESVFSRVVGLFSRPRIDEELWEELEALLLQADVGVATTDEVLDRLRERVRGGAVRDVEQLHDALKAELVALLEQIPDGKPLVRPNGLNTILVVGVNGVGKTTSIAKLGHYYRDEGRKVLLAAGDTFRAAAIDQLKIWGERAGLPVIAHQPGADPGAVVYDAVAAARARGLDLVIVDTAGRLHTKYNLMEELKKLRRILDKQQVEHVSVLLVIDATTGQNAIAQARTFADAVGLDGVVVAKLDGTARGGVVFALARELRVPIRFVGTGEKIDDLSEFSAGDFVHALFQVEPAPAS